MEFDPHRQTMNPEGLMAKPDVPRRLEDLLQESAARHSHLCPRQVLGVRMGLLAGRVLELGVPDAHKRLLTLVETDGCAADAVSVATGCTVGNRRLRVLDFGKVAATFIDVRHSDEAIRIAPRKEIRVAARHLAPEARSRWHAQLQAYQVMRDEELLEVQQVELSTPLEKLLSRPGCRAVCAACGEEIINERELVVEGLTLCRACAGQSYYRLAGSESCPLSEALRTGQEILT